MFADHSEQPRPLGAYALLIGSFNALLAGGVAVAARRGRLPERYSAHDLLLLTAGTYKASRLVAKDRVTSALRAPFTRFEDDIGFGEVAEQARGRGLRLAVGEALVCPHCVGQWIAGGFVVGHALAPGATRMVSAVFAVRAAADWLHLAHGKATGTGD